MQMGVAPQKLAGIFLCIDGSARREDYGERCGNDSAHEISNKGGVPPASGADNSGTRYRAAPERS